MQTDTKAFMIIDKNGTIYKGETQGGKRNGLGISIYYDGRVYKGQWKNDYPEGFGIYKTNFGFIISSKFDKDLNLSSQEAKINVEIYL